MRNRKGLHIPVGGLLWFCLALAMMASLCAEAAPPVVPAVIQRNYDIARQNYLANPGNDAAAWQFGRACFDRAEYSRDSTERASLANQGMAACAKVISHQPGLAAGHYYMAMNMAQLARTKLLGALPLVNQMEAQWKTARALDERIDFAGPDRFLGQLYRDAPGWPVSIGDTPKAKKHLLRAVELSPNFPENNLNLIESCLEWNDTSAAGRALAKLQLILPAARKEFADEYWQESWKDWNQRLEKIEARLGVDPPPPPSDKK
jgi:tetratricopeptide (TPR) repeat protein